MKLLAKIRVWGRVQGVFFRHSAKKKAEELDIFGFIRNEPDGQSVYIEAWGEEERLNKFIEWCRVGPFLARVEKVKVEYTKESVDYERFEISQ